MKMRLLPLLMGALSAVLVACAGTDSVHGDRGGSECGSRMEKNVGRGRIAFFWDLEMLRADSLLVGHESPVKFERLLDVPTDDIDCLMTVGFDRVAFLASAGIAVNAQDSGSMSVRDGDEVGTRLDFTVEPFEVPALPNVVAAYRGLLQHGGYAGVVNSGLDDHGPAIGIGIARGVASDFDLLVIWTGDVADLDAGILAAWKDSTLRDGTSGEPELVVGNGFALIRVAIDSDPNLWLDAPTVLDPLMLPGFYTSARGEAHG